MTSYRVLWAIVVLCALQAGVFAADHSVDRMDTKMIDAWTRILDGERNGSLKKDQVHDLEAQVNKLQNKLDNGSTNGTLTASKLSDINNQLSKINNQISSMEGWNLRPQAYQNCKLSRK